MQTAAEELHLIDIGGLEANHGRCGDAEDRREKFPGKATERDDISEIERDSNVKPESWRP